MQAMLKPEKVTASKQDAELLVSELEKIAVHCSESHYHVASDFIRLAAGSIREKRLMDYQTALL